MKTTGFIAALSALLLLSACGGGGGDSAVNQPPIRESAAGLWTGSTNSGADIASLILEDGTFYNFYSAPGSNSIYGVIVGNGVTSKGTFYSTNAIDVNFAGYGAAQTTVSANFSSKRSLSGTVNYSASQKVGFTSTYNYAYEARPTLAAIAGSYKGAVATVAGEYIDTSSTNLIIGPDGSVNGGGYGCSVYGSVAPHSSGNVYQVSISYMGASCPIGVGKMFGHAFFDSSRKIFYSVAINSGRSAGLVFVGNKQ